ncbi:MAG: ATP-binding protein [Planctomycetota bacterium]|jgi:serine/threonine-protein kinase RsbW
MGEVIQDRIEVKALTENLKFVREFMSRMVGASALAEMDRNKVVLAVDEAVANIVRHAYGGSGKGIIQIQARADARKLEIHIFDSGSKFDPNSVKDPDMMEHIRLGKKTGLGIFLMRQIMDEVSYSFREGKNNELYLAKYIQSPDAPKGESA